MMTATTDRIRSLPHGRRYPLFITLFATLTVGREGHAQTDSTRVTLRVMRDSMPVYEAVVSSGVQRTRTRKDGIALLVLSRGPRLIVVSKLGFRPETLQVALERADTSVVVALTEQPGSLATMVIASTRSNKRVEDDPTRVEVLGSEELSEKTSMSPGSVSMLLNETSGVRVVSTSPTLGGANVRIQGLRGRYTQILSDGLPLYGLSTEGLGLLQIPPLDLQRVEVVKGAASAMYGPAALGGVVNFISRAPEDTREFLLNQTSRDATDFLYYGGKSVTPLTGYTVLGSVHRQRQRDLDSDGWADLASYERAVVRPRLFINSASGQSLFATLGLTTEDREGGTVGAAVVPDGRAYRQTQQTTRVDGGTVLRLPLHANSNLTLRASMTRQQRKQRFGTFTERDDRTTTFAELSFGRAIGKQLIIAGAAFQGDAFAEPAAPLLSYTSSTPAAFVQHTWSPTQLFGITSSARVDRHNALGTFLSPRLSVLLRPTIFAHPFTTRFSAGGGVFTPTPFTEETDEISFRRLRPLTGIRAERARNAAADVGSEIGPLQFNVSAYASRVSRAVTLVPAPNAAGTPDAKLVNATQPTQNSGVEVFAQYRIDEFRVTATYARIQATEWDEETFARRAVPLTPPNSGGVVLSWESEDGARVGFEGYYTGRQFLEHNPYRLRSPGYTLLGALGQVRVGRALVFLNAENLLDVRQTKTDPVLLRSPGLGGRWTTEAWAPLEGRLVNLGVRFGSVPEAHR